MFDVLYIKLAPYVSLFVASCSHGQVFCELERVLDSELDFRAEAQAMEKIAAGVAHTVDGNRAKPPITVPRPVPGLCSGRVLVMEYVQVKQEEEGIEGWCWYLRGP